MQGGNAAEVFFHAQLPRYDQFDDYQIEDMYHEIFLGTVAGREQNLVYAQLSDATGSHDPTGTTLGFKKSSILQVDRRAFASWWLSSQMETKDTNLEKQRLQVSDQHSSPLLNLNEMKPHNLHLMLALIVGCANVLCCGSRGLRSWGRD